MNKSFFSDQLVSPRMNLLSFQKALLPSSSVPMAAVATPPSPSGSFVYEDLVGKVQTIQRQMMEMENFINDRCENQKAIPPELKSRSLVFIDPYGNRLVNEHLDHQLIAPILKKYRKDFLPKYLRSWTQIGVRQVNGNIQALKLDQLSSTVADYPNEQEFLCFGEVTVWVGDAQHLTIGKVTMKVSLIDQLEKVKEEIRKDRAFTTLELRSSHLDSSVLPTETHWSGGKGLKFSETILSSRLYEERSLLMARLDLNPSQ